MREVRGSNRMAALDRVAVLTALNLAAELLQGKDKGGSQDQAIVRTLGEMNRKLDGLFDSLAMR
jgi:cell division protein ZapA